MGNNSVPKFIFRLSRFPVYRGSVLGRFYCSCVVLEPAKGNTQRVWGQKFGDSGAWEVACLTDCTKNVFHYMCFQEPQNMGFVKIHIN
jgi:hypothetical protein